MKQSNSGSSNLWTFAALASTTVAVTAGSYYFFSQKRKRHSNNKKAATPASLDEKDSLVLQRFEQCVVHMKSKIGKLPQSTQLDFYAWYKQATLGDCDLAPPPAYELVAKTKYQVWNQVKGMPRTAAMQLYIDKAVLIEFTSEMQSENTADLEGEAIMDIEGLGVKQSTLMGNEDDEGSEYRQNYPLHYAARENHLEQLGAILKTVESPDTLDPSGQTALHLAADRGHVESIKFLVKSGANVGAADHDGISVLQAAVISGHLPVCKLLCQLGANPDQPDVDGDTPRNCAHDDPKLCELLFRASQGQLILDEDFQKELQDLGRLPQINKT